MENRNATKEDIAEMLSEITGDSAAHSKKVVDGLVGIIKDILCKGQPIQIRSLGTFKVVDRKDKTAHDFKTGQRLIVPARKSVKFIPGKDFKNRIER